MNWNLDCVYVGGNIVSTPSSNISSKLRTLFVLHSFSYMKPIVEHQDECILLYDHFFLLVWSSIEHEICFISSNWNIESILFFPTCLTDLVSLIYHVKYFWSTTLINNTSNMNILFTAYCITQNTAYLIIKHRNMFNFNAA